MVFLRSDWVRGGFCLFFVLVLLSTPPPDQGGARDLVIRSPGSQLYFSCSFTFHPVDALLRPEPGGGQRNLSIHNVA